MKRWMVRGLAAGLAVGAGWLLLGATLRGRAEAAATRLEARYGAGCVATLVGPGHAGRLRCRLANLQAGVAYADFLPPDWRLKIEVDGVALALGGAPRLAVDLFDAEGRPVGTFGGAPAQSGALAQLFGPPLRHPFPLVVAVRPARRGE